MFNLRCPTCQICLDVLYEPVALICGHVFCWSCVYHWFNSNTKCPTCLKDAVELLPLYMDLPLNPDREVDYMVPPRPDAMCLMEGRVKKSPAKVKTKWGLWCTIACVCLYIVYQVMKI